MTDMGTRSDEPIRKIHMDIPWHTAGDGDVPAVRASLTDKSSLVGRVGLMMLSVGTGAWRIRDSMNTVAVALGITCSADVGLLTIDYTCFDDTDHSTHTLSLHTSGVNTDKLFALEDFIRRFPDDVKSQSIRELHEELNQIQEKKANYTPAKAGLAAAFACCAFTFLLGGGPAEMVCAFIGAGIGNCVRRMMIDRKMTLFACVIVSVALACCSYVGAIKLAEMLWGVSASHQAGYICAMLFVIPGFPLITGGIDLAKLDMRSGLERLAYALLIILLATMVGWVTAYVLRFSPDDFAPLPLDDTAVCLLRLVASFVGVYGFSIMFNSPRKMAMTAAAIGMIANTLRLEFVDLGGMTIGMAAFTGALIAGLIATFARMTGRKNGFPRISLTVPSIVIMVPGLYMYRGVYYLALSNVSGGSLWLTRAALAVIALPLGLVVARILTDRHFRHSS